MYAEAYRRGHDRIVQFMDGRDVDVMVPACPGWSALDVLRHLAGDAADIVERNFVGFGSEEWTQAQVEARAGDSYEDLLTEWAATIGPASESLDAIDDLDLPPSIPSALGPLPPRAIPATAIGDILHHEFDLRNAYGDTGGRELMDVHFSAAGHVKSLRGRFAAWDLETIRVESTDSGMGWDIGFEEPVAVLQASSFELMRAIGGRRTRGEMRAMGWEGDPEPFLDHMVLPHLQMRETSLRE